MNLLSFGEIIWDVYENEKFIGGAPLNLAAHAQKQGASSYMLSAVGSDDLGKTALREIEDFKIKTDFITVNTQKKTGQCLVTLDESGIPSYNVLTDVAYDYITAPENIKNTDFDYFCFGTLALRSEENKQEVKRLLKALNIKNVYCDVNIRPPFFSDDVILFALQHSDILKVSDEELHYILNAADLKEASIEEALKALSLKYGNLKFILLTQGEKGACVYDCKNEKQYFKNAPSVTVKSSVGAGDSFGATFLCEHFKTNDIEKSLSKAIEVSAFVVSQKEAIPEY